MFEGKTEKEARSMILEAVKDYCDRYHTRPVFTEGQRIPYASRIYDHDEMANLVDSSFYQFNYHRFLGIFRVVSKCNYLVYS